MICVVDANAAAEIVLERASAIDLINRILAADKVIAPSLFYAEAANTFRKYVQGGFFDAEKGMELFRKTIQIVDEFVDIAELSEEAFSEAVRRKHSVYDMLYLILARRNGAKLLTLDKKLQQLYAAI